MSQELDKRCDLRVSREELEEKGSVGLGVLALMGLPAKAWDWRLRVAMVEKWWWWWWWMRENERVLERERKKEVVEEERNNNIGALFHLSGLQD